MTAPLVFFPLPTLVDQIAALCAQKRTANVVLISDDNRMAQVHLLQGIIMFVMCRGRRGPDGLALMRTMSHARMSIDSNAVVRSEGSAFSTASVLAYLKGATEQLPVLTEVESLEPAPPTAAVAPAAPSIPETGPADRPKTVVTADMRYLLQTAMVRYIGPMAEIVCEEHFAAAHDLPALIAALADEIPNAGQSSAFKAEVARSLA